MKDIILFGAGGHCHAIVSLINSLGEYRPSIIYDDAPITKEILQVPVKKYAGESLSDSSMCVTIGDNGMRKAIAEKFNKQYPSFVHQSAVIYGSSDIGNGTLVLPNSVIDASVTIGDFCLINNNATISHNSVLGDFCHIAINVAVSGGVKIGEGTLIGAGSIILPEITIGKWAIIGAGAVVTKDVPDFAVVYGNPSKIMRINQS
jgi:sugar O-acyltransferase (sialic acid O-acetyltransferase NeuD family)